MKGLLVGPRHWTEEIVVKTAVHDPHGNTAMLYFTDMNLKANQ